MMEGEQHGEQLKRGLKNRHIQLIALGGAIGTGLFLGSASEDSPQGQGLSWLRHCWFIAFLIMRQLGEMVVEEPVAAPLATLLINTGAVCWFRLWLELLGTVRFSCHGRADCRG
ncbi:hypothetical protein ACLK1T_07015 [Escherichia coli]